MPADRSSKADRKATASAPKPAVARLSPTARSRVGNGAELITGIDKRSLAYRQFRDVVSDLAQHLGGAPSVVEQAIIEEAAGLVIWCRQTRQALLEGGEFNIAAYTTATNALRRLLVDIGLEARMKTIVPTLDEHLASGNGEAMR